MPPREDASGVRQSLSEGSNLTNEDKSRSRRRSKKSEAESFTIYEDRVLASEDSRYSAIVVNHASNHTSYPRMSGSLPTLDDDDRVIRRSSSYSNNRDTLNVSRQRETATTTRPIGRSASPTTRRPTTTSYRSDGDNTSVPPAPRTLQSRPQRTSPVRRHLQPNSTYGDRVPPAPNPYRFSNNPGDRQRVRHYRSLSPRSNGSRASNSSLSELGFDETTVSRTLFTQDGTGTPGA